MVTSKTLVMLGDFNTILSVRVDSVGSTNRKGNHDVKQLLKSFSLVDWYRLQELLVPQWT